MPAPISRGPVPLALQTDTAYELETAGTRTGMLDLAFARNFRQNSADATSNFDDGWFGYGKIQPPRAKQAIAAKPTGKSTGHAYEVQDDGKPHFGSKPDNTDTASRRAPDPDPADTDRATRISLPDDSRDPKAPDPDRPTLRRSTTDTTGGPKQKRDKPVSSVTQTPPNPNDDPDRPSLKRKGAGETDSGIPAGPKRTGEQGDRKRRRRHRHRTGTDDRRRQPPGAAPRPAHHRTRRGRTGRGGTPLNSTAAFRSPT